MRQTDQKKLVTRRWLLGGVAAATLGFAMPALAKDTNVPPAKASRPPPPRPSPPGSRSAEALISAAGLGGRVGYLVIDAASGKVLEGDGTDLALPPASVAKTLTTLYALEVLGADYRFATHAIATGPVAGGLVQGDLVLAGGGDPTLVTDDLGAMVDALAEAGVKGVTGRFLVADGALPHIAEIDPSQPDQVDYNPGLSGLNLNFNRVYFGWRRQGAGWAVTMDARGDRFDPPVSVARMAVTDRAAPPYTYTMKDGTERWTVASAALGRGGSRWLPVRAPGPYAGDVFHALAAARGIALPAPAMAQGTVTGTSLVTHRSDDLRSILREMLKYSTNVTAEVVGLTASIAQGGPVDSLAASARRMTDWAKGRFGVSLNLIDHSGLGLANRATPADLVRLLAASGPDGLRAILKPIPFRDARGRPLANGPAEVQGKSGTLNFVSNLVGFETTPGGRHLIFAIFAADVARSAAVPPGERESAPGMHAWVRRAHQLQEALLERWANVYGS